MASRRKGEVSERVKSRICNINKRGGFTKIYGCVFETTRAPRPFLILALCGPLKKLDGKGQDSSFAAHF